VAAHSKALLDAGSAHHAELAAVAADDAVVGRERAGMAGGGPLSFSRDPALQQDERLRGGEAAQRLQERTPVADTLGVGQRDGGLRVRGEVVEVVRDRRLRRVAAGDRLADADPGEHGVVEQRGAQVAALARHRMRPGGG
jgi:hypothetical protein